jgi:hypothetical protein
MMTLWTKAPRRGGDSVGAGDDDVGAVGGDVPGATVASPVAETHRTQTPTQTTDGCQSSDHPRQMVVCPILAVGPLKSRPAVAMAIHSSENEK